MLQQREEMMRQDRTNRSELQKELAETRSLTIDLPADRDTWRGRKIFLNDEFLVEPELLVETPSWLN